MSNPNVDVLNDVTKTLIDSHKGYQKVSDLADSSYALRSKFISLAAERQDLIAAFQKIEDDSLRRSLLNTVRAAASAFESKQGED